MSAKSKDLFVKSLRRIGFYQTDSLDIESMVQMKELKSFFELFSTLNENNRLTTEELVEYSSLTPDELREIEMFEKREQLENNEKEKEVLFLKEQLAHIENHNASIERQIDSFKKWENDLLEEKELQHNVLLDTQRIFQSYQMNKVPDAQREYISSLKSVLEIANDLESLIKHSDANKLPASDYFKNVVQQYLDAEERVLHSVNVYIQNNFQLQEDGTLSLINTENSRIQDIIKKVTFLRKVLKSSMVDKILTEKEIKKCENIVKYLQTVKLSDFSCHSSQLRYKLDEVLELNKQLKEKEQELEYHASNSSSKHVDALLTEIDLIATNESFNNFQFYLKEMLLPMNTLMHQAGRFALLNAFLNGHKQELQNIKDLIQKFVNDIKQELLELDERKVLMQDKISHAAQEEDTLLKTVILPSLYKILDISGDVEDSVLSEVSVEDVVQKANQLIEIKENCTRKSEEKMKTLDSVEKHEQSLESLLHCFDKECPNWREMKQEFNVSLNNLCLKSATLERSLTECTEELNTKEKILSKKANLRLARKLFIYALLNTELYKKCIDDIQNGAGSSMH